MLNLRSLLALSCLAAPLAGCANANHTTNGAAMGAGLGTLAGAIVGHQSGKRAEGALVGAAAGALGGGLIGNAKDEREKAESWQSYAAHTERVQAAQQAALSTQDIIQMTQTTGLDEQIIIQSIQNRGVNFDPNPDALVFLANNNVSKTVIRAIQSQTRR